jgi:hypothetical protein
MRTASTAVVAAVAAALVGLVPAATRPICMYPEVAAYRGHGDTSAASGFVCRRPTNH